ncbi:ROK family protein [bacterium]|nr:ROK family protein [bacterium]
MNILVVDVGGSQVKLHATGQPAPRRFESGRSLTPAALVEDVRRRTADWPHEAVSLGYPGAVGPDGPEAEPGNLGDGWVGFDFAEAFGRPVRVVNDAAMQALGAYTGGRMLFLGLGTGLGSALVTDRVVIPLELGTLPYGRRQTWADRLGRRGLKRYGEAAWLTTVTRVVEHVREAMKADYVVLGGGNAKRVRPLPPHTRRGGNEDAFAGGFRLWEEEVDPHRYHTEAAWRVVR